MTALRPPQVFVSHASADRVHADAVIDALRNAGIAAIIASEPIGGRFVQFIEQALSTSDYCLLLWSAAAAASPWVAAEWESALARSIRERRAFLVVGRLEDLAVPALVAARVWVDLFPRMTAGIAQLIAEWTGDRTAARTAGRPVAANARNGLLDGGPDTVYVTSELFAFTLLTKASLPAPAGVLLDRLVDELDLPRDWRYQDRLSIHFDYALEHSGSGLTRGVALAAQGVEPGAVLTLVTAVSLATSAAPIGGTPSGRYRSPSQALPAFVVSAARRHQRERLRATGLVPDPPIDDRPRSGRQRT